MDPTCTTRAGGVESGAAVGPELGVSGDVARIRLGAVDAAAIEVLSLSPEVDVVAPPALQRDVAARSSRGLSPGSGQP